MLSITVTYNYFDTTLLALLLDPFRDRQFDHWTLSDHVARTTP